MSAAACVVDSRAVAPRDDGARPTLGTSTGFGTLLEQQVLACEPGRSLWRATGSAEEVLFVLDGEGTLHAAGAAHLLEPESGAYLAPGESYELSNTGSEMLRVVAVQIPDPEHGDGTVRAHVRRLADQAAEAATTDREFRIVADPESGLRSATHFVGYIPMRRAPDHFHTYDEVIYVLDGSGVLHTAEGAEGVQAGSCIQLPARTVHCLENTGADVMRVVAVFRPAGSPAAAYHPDGTPAFAEASKGRAA
jgi:mannose-6-phosphate isomerase-like protein (cupin superfamily)